MAFCIPRHLVSRLKEAAFKSDFDLAGLLEMSSKDRNAYFSKMTDAELGKFLNVEFEKAITKGRLIEWVESTFDPKEKKGPVYKSIVDKINALDEMGVLNPATEKEFLADFVADKLGAYVNPEEVKIISEKAKKIDIAQKNVGDDLGTVSKEKETLEFFKAKKEMDDYLQSLNPASRLKVATGTIGRGFMLASVKSPILNIGSNMELAFTEVLSRRIATGQFSGANNKLAIDYMKMVNRIYQETGYDISRMMNLSDAGTSGQRVLGETVHAKGKGAIRKTGRIVEDIVFKQIMGAPDVYFSAGNFSDSINLNSMKMAKGNKKLATEWMQDAMRLNPKTEQGSALKAQGVLDAQTATWTNTTWASKASEGIRKVLNDVSGDLRLGDYFLPFIRTPANVVATGMDYSGLGIFKGLAKFINAKRSGVPMTGQQIQSITRDLTRSGLGLTGAIILTANLDEDDFVGAYDPSRRQIEELRNSNWNAIRLGEKWISTAWLGPLAVPVTAMMYGKKYGKTIPEKIFQFGKGVLMTAGDIPGVSDIYDFFKANYGRKDLTLEEATGESSEFIINEIASRLVPNILSDIANALDPNQRVTKGQGKFAPLKAKVPFLRKTLPEKMDVFGETVKGESPVSEILFGARVKTDRETDLLKKLGAISNEVGKSINFTDWDKSSSKKLTQFRRDVDKETFKQAKLEYGQRLKTAIEDIIEYEDYDDMDTLYKKIIGLDTKIMNEVLDDYGFVYEKEER